MSSLRFETAGKKSISKAQARQQERVRNDEKIEAQEQVLRNDVKATLRAEWNESLEEASQRRSLKSKREQIHEEVRLANKALTDVRREQLLQLLTEEQRQYEEELHSMGLALHKDRL